MYKEGQLIAVNGNIYEYGGEENADFTKDLKLHKVYVVDIDEDGNLTHTHRSDYLTTEELSNKEIHLTQDQWHRIVEQLIRYEYADLTEEAITDATEDIVGRCFAYGIPKFDELEAYIACYMNR